MTISHHHALWQLDIVDDEVVHPDQVVITDGEERSREVHGEGVVGEQPSIAPGQEFHYSSGAILETEVGSMRGSYQMIGEDGIHFDAQIPAFTLAVPHALH